MLQQVVDVIQAAHLHDLSILDGIVQPVTTHVTVLSSAP